MGSLIIPLSLGVIIGATMVFVVSVIYIETHNGYFRKETNMETKLGKTGMMAPWNEYVAKLKALFGNDPDVDIDYDQDLKVVTMRIADQDKAMALMQILPSTVTFGNIALMIKVIPANFGEENMDDLLMKAFRGNPAFVRLSCGQGAFQSFRYMVFKKEVVQYFNDDLGSEGGIRSTLYQELAKELLPEVGGLFFCTCADADEAGERQL